MTRKIDQLQTRSDILFYGETGSNLYGTATSDSDLDIRGVYLPSLISMFSTRLSDAHKELDLSHQSKDPITNKNTSEAVDIKLTSFFKLGAQLVSGSPSELELTYISDAGIATQLRQYACLKHATKFLAYGSGQISRIPKEMKRFREEGSLRALVKGIDRDLLVRNALPVTMYTGHLEIANFKLPTNRTIGELQDFFAENPMSYRQVLALELGYDPKYASHAIRTVRQAYDLASSGKLTFPLPYADQIRDIKLGKFTLDEITEMKNDYESVANSAIEKSSLPPEVDEDKLNKFIYETSINHYKINE